METSGDESKASGAKRGEVTAILARASAGDPVAVEILLPMVYAQLRAIAGAYFQAKPANHTLQPTALVHEAYLKLVGSTASWKDRAHFCAVAATAMRQILSNHAQAKRAAKRDAKRVALTVDDMPTPTGASTLDLLDLDEALNELTGLNARHAPFARLCRSTLQGRSLYLLEGFLDLLAGGAVDAGIRDVPLPVDQVVVLRLKAGESFTLQRIILNVGHPAFDLALVARRVRFGG